MKLHLDNASGVNVVRSCDATGIVVNETRHTRSLILSAGIVTGDWRVADVDAFDEAACRDVAAHEADIVLLGTGRRQHMVDPWYMAWFAARGMGLEVMDTFAACRTYNILAAEDRRVVAALIVEGE